MKTIRLKRCPQATLIPMKKTARALIRIHKENDTFSCVFITDQRPYRHDLKHWMTFLNQETPVFTGAERIMSKMNNAVFFIEVERPRRGQYVFKYQLMTREPSKMEHGELTRQYFARLEDSIRRNPSIYLWTHDRWKRTREEFERRYVVKNGHNVGVNR